MLCSQCSARFYLITYRLCINRVERSGLLLVRKILLHAIRAKTVGELRVSVFGNIGLHLVPIALVVTNLFARGTDGQQAGERFDRGQGGFGGGSGLPQVIENLLPLQSIPD